MKGISTVLATILLLLITLALIGMAAGFIFGWWGRASQGIEYTGGATCVEGAAGQEDKVQIPIRNIGTVTQTVEVKQTAPSGDTANPDSITIEPGQTYIYTDDCTGTGTSRYCVYTFTPKMGGFPLPPISVPCL
jgi:flagellin-like protein